MPEEVTKLRVFLASPGDVKREREALPPIIDRLNKGVAQSGGLVLELVRWEKDTWADFGREAQSVINEQIGVYDVFIGIMWNRIGTPTREAPSGTVEEFRRAYRLWETHKRPKLMFYFNDEPSCLETEEELQQRGEVLRFRKTLHDLGGYYWIYKSLDEFKNMVLDHLTKVIQDIAASGIPGTEPPATEDIVPERLDPHDIQRLQVPGRPSIYSSFNPTKENPFRQICIDTTPGYVGGNWEGNEIDIIRDPIRPYEIHVGRTRWLREEGSPEAIPDLATLDLDEIKDMYAFIHTRKYRWLRMVLAELAANPDILDFLGKEDNDEVVRKLAARNPSSSKELQQRECIFCNARFRASRKLDYGRALSGRTVIFHNDYPYGPYFHYIAMPGEPIHAWEDMTEDHLRAMNMDIWQFLKHQKERGQLLSAGIFIGFNSTIRHLVLRRRIRTSAGATVAHVHKQIWGMAPGSVNIGDHLSSICSAYYENELNVDYLGEYLGALRRSGYVVWEDGNVALYVPFGQVSVHELQIMVKRETHDYLDLNQAEIGSLSKAEFYATRLYKRIGIHSFNELIISEPFDRRTRGFRLITAFITREIDLAVAELNHIYVVNKYPKDTLEEIGQHVRDIVDEVK